MDKVPGERAANGLVSWQVCRSQANLGLDDDTFEVMQKQVEYCADHGLVFLAFDRYYPKTVSLNNALGLKAENRQRPKFCLLVTNEKSRLICPSD